MNPSVRRAAPYRGGPHVIGGGRGSARKSMPANAHGIVGHGAFHPLLPGRENCDTATPDSGFTVSPARKSLPPFQPALSSDGRCAADGSEQEKHRNQGRRTAARSAEPAGPPRP